MAKLSKKKLKAIDAAVAKVRAEVIRATKLHGSFNSAHEAYGVLIEEVEEFFDEVKANKPKRAKVEAVQVAAMAVKFLTSI